uniref:Coactivator associated arginine methyltransferase 1 n=1 Tax=Panthera leo TaxID=9689 RepID=A0A8C9D0Q3_PANLE
MAAAAAAAGPGAGGAGTAVPSGAGPCAAVSVFPGARLLTIGDANGEIQRHAEQQALRLEVRAGPDAAGIALYSHEDVCVFKCSVSRETECSRVGKQSFIITLGCNSVLIQFATPNVLRLPVPAAEHDAGLRADGHLPARHPAEPHGLQGQDRSGRGLWLWHPLVFRRPGRGEEDLRGGGQHHGPARRGERPTGTPACPRALFQPGEAGPAGRLDPHIRGARAQRFSVLVSCLPQPRVDGLAGREAVCALRDGVGARSEVFRGRTASCPRGAARAVTRTRVGSRPRSEPHSPPLWSVGNSKLSFRLRCRFLVSFSVR